MTRARAAQLEATVNEWKAKAEEQAQAIEAQQAATKDGGVVARGFNSFLNTFTGDQDRFDAVTSQAVSYYRTELPEKLDRFHQLISGARTEADVQAAQRFLQGALNEASVHGQQFDSRRGELQSSTKFWSGLAADMGAGLMVLGGTAVAMTGFGAPIGAGMIAAGFAAGGALSVGGHALLDNQYDFQKEALGNFMVGGVSAATTIFTAGAGTALTATTSRMVATQAATGGITSFAGEAANGFQDGWSSRVLLGTATGTVLGTAANKVAAGIAPDQIQNALLRGTVNGTVGAASGGINATGGAFVNEMLTGFQEDWQSRVAMQALGGAVSGAAYGLTPDLYARNEALKRQAARSQEPPVTLPPAERAAQP